MEGFLSGLQAAVPAWLQRCVRTPEGAVLYAPPWAIPPLLRWLRDHGRGRFQQLIDVTAVDYPARPQRFEVVYHLLSVRHNARLCVKTCVDEVQPVPSCTALFPAAGWAEREVWDLFGVPFTGHPDLRRLLTDYGFQGHPLRKDFPLSGYVEVRYDETQKRVIYEPVELSQEFRYFAFRTPWEGRALPAPRGPQASDADPTP